MVREQREFSRAGACSGPHREDGVVLVLPVNGVHEGRIELELTPGVLTVFSQQQDSPGRPC